MIAFATAWVASTIGAHFDGLYNLPDGQTLAEAVKAGTRSLKFSIEIGRAMAHGLSGGVFSELGGGDFGGGFAAGAFGSLAGSAMTTAKGQGFFGQAGDGDFTGLTKRTVAAAIVGGTAAELGGGKFANGAATAGIQHLFNAEGWGEAFHNQDPPQEVTLEIASYSLSESGSYGHAFLLVTDDSGVQWVSRAGPSGAYPGGSEAVVLDLGYDGITVQAEGFVRYEGSREQAYVKAAGGIAKRETLPGMSSSEWVSFRDKVQSYADDVNRAGIRYKPRSFNSNAYVYGAIRHVLNRDLPQSSFLPGSGSATQFNQNVYP